MDKSNYKNVPHLALVSLVVALVGCQETPAGDTGLSTNEECNSNSSSSSTCMLKRSLRDENRII